MVKDSDNLTESTFQPHHSITENVNVLDISKHLTVVQALNLRTI